jgi:hypothetical protein
MEGYIKALAGQRPRRWYDVGQDEGESSPHGEEHWEGKQRCPTWAYGSETVGPRFCTELQEFMAASPVRRDIPERQHARLVQPSFRAGSRQLGLQKELRNDCPAPDGKAGPLPLLQGVKGFGI